MFYFSTDLAWFIGNISQIWLIFNKIFVWINMNLKSKLVGYTDTKHTREIRWQKDGNNVKWLRNCKQT